MARSRPSSARAVERLRGVTVLVARPVGRGASIAERVRMLGGDAIHLPTASLRVTDTPAQARAVLARAHAAHATVFTSATAVKFASAVAPDLDFATMRTIAVGPSTARALAWRGAEPILPSLRFDSEGVLALPELSNVRGRRVVIVTAPGGRDEMARTLMARGARVEHALVYRRTLPRWHARHHEALRELEPPCALVVSSAEAIAALGLLAGDEGFALLKRVPAFAGSARVAQALRRAGFRGGIHVARSALAHDLVEALAAQRR
jgi:uroporphyrinogen-III synthase